VGEYGCEHREVERLVIEGKAVFGGPEPPGGFYSLLKMSASEKV